MVELFTNNDVELEVVKGCYRDIDTDEQTDR